MMIRSLALAFTLAATTASAHGNAASHVHAGQGAPLLGGALVVIGLSLATAILARRQRRLKSADI